MKTATIDIVQKDRLRCRKKFLHYFPKGFADKKYVDWERGYKWNAHLLWEEELNRSAFQSLLSAGDYAAICSRAARMESKTNLLFSFEKMALRDAIKPEVGAKSFALGLFEYVYGAGSLKTRFENFTEVLAELPRRQTRVLTWPLQTVFGFIARPEEYIFLKPKVTKIAAGKYGYPFHYESRPNWKTYKSLLDFADQVRQDLKDLAPKDLIDIQSFMWVLGSEEYPD